METGQEITVPEVHCVLESAVVHRGVERSHIAPQSLPIDAHRLVAIPTQRGRPKGAAKLVQLVSQRAASVGVIELGPEQRNERIAAM
jgi:hypothetical protein